MKKLFAVLLLLIIGESAYAEYVTILPVSSQALSSASSEIVTLSELYGKTTTIRYMADDKTPAGVALNNTNIYPLDSLTLTEDVLQDNQMFGFYVGAARQVAESKSVGSDDYIYDLVYTNSDSDFISESQSSNILRTIAFTDSKANYQTILDRSKAEAGSNIALAKIIEEQINRASDSELLALDTDLETDNTLLADDRTTSLMDAILPGHSQSNDYDLPLSGNNILISGLGGSILSGGGSAGSGAAWGYGSYGSYGGNGGGSGVDGVFFLADGSAASVPEPSTWALLVLGVAGLAFYRKRIAK